MKEIFSKIPGATPDKIGGVGWLPELSPREPFDYEKSQARMHEFCGWLLGKWYECAPYGEQVPKELPRLFAEFVARHGNRISSDEMWEAFDTSEPEDPILKLFECIFSEGARFATNCLADAVYDRNLEQLRLIDIEPLGVMATPQNDPAQSCPNLHILHPNNGGFLVFVATTEVPPVTLPDATKGYP